MGVPCVLGLFGNPAWCERSCFRFRPLDGAGGSGDVAVMIGVPSVCREEVVAAAPGVRDLRDRVDLAVLFGVLAGVLAPVIELTYSIIDSQELKRSVSSM